MWTYVQFVPEIVYLLWIFYTRFLSIHLSRFLPARFLVAPRVLLSFPLLALATRSHRWGMHNLNVPRPSFSPFQENCWLLCRGYLPGESREDRLLAFILFRLSWLILYNATRGNARLLVEKVFYGYGDTQTRYVAAAATASSTAR